MKSIVVFVKSGGFHEKHCGFHEKHLKSEKHNEKHQKQLIQHRSLIWTWCFIEYRGKANWVYLIFWWYLVVHMCLVVHVCVCGVCMVTYVFGDTHGVCICILYMCGHVYNGHVFGGVCMYMWCMYIHVCFGGACVICMYVCVCVFNKCIVHVMHVMLHVC